MYAIAVASIVKRVVNFGTYEPLVARLGVVKCNKERAQLIGSVNAFKTIVLILSLLGLLIFANIRGMDDTQTIIIVLVCLGFGLETVCETVLADVRLRGEQNEEGRIKRIAYFFSYCWGLIALMTQCRPMVVASYKLIGALILLNETKKLFDKRYSHFPFFYLSLQQISSLLRVASAVALVHLLGIIYNKIHIFYLEAYAGVRGVAYYMATWNLIDPVSVLFTQQLLSWILFPVLATQWSRNRGQAKNMVRNNVLWMAALASPAMAFFFMESKLIIGTLYPTEYGDAIWMQQLLVAAIPLSLISNLFIYLMVTAGHVTALLLITSAATILCFLGSYFIIPRYLLAGGCYVILGTRFFVALTTSMFCQYKYQIMAFTDLLKTIAIPTLIFAVCSVLTPVLTIHGSTALVLGVYVVLLYVKGVQLLGCLGGTNDERR